MIDLAEKTDLIAFTRDALKTMLNDVWDAERDPALVEAIAQDVAAQHALWLTATTEDEKALRVGNIRRLYSRAGNIAAARYLKAAQAGQTVFLGVIQVAVSLLVQAAFPSSFAIASR